jgi:hypothetical protein
MKRGQLRYSILIFLILFLSVLLVANFSGIIKTSITGNVVSIPTSCSNSSITDTWNNIFKESATGIRIFTDNTITEGTCNQYFAYKNNSNNFFLVLGYITVEEGDSGEDVNVTRIYAYSINTTSNLSSVILSFSSLSNTTSIINSEDGSLDINSTFFQSNIDKRASSLTLSDINSTYNSFFEESSENSWTENTLQSTTTYEYEKNSDISANNLDYFGIIDANYSFNEFYFIQTPITSGCIQNLTCGNWSGCINATQDRTCIDLNNCTSNNTIIQNQTCTLCTSDWLCEAWSTCISLQQSRTCSDLNNCTLNNTKVETQSCTPPCTPSWICGNWTPSECPKNETQKRICTDSNNCGTNTGKPSETQSCDYTGSNMVFIVVIILLILLMLVIFGVLFYMWKKNNEMNTSQINPISPFPRYPPAPPFPQSRPNSSFSQSQQNQNQIQYPVPQLPAS